MESYKFTVADLKRQLASFNDDDEVGFEGRLTFSRLKRRGENLVVIEFNEIQAYLDDEFKSGNPDVQVAFLKNED